MFVCSNKNLSLCSAVLVLTLIVLDVVSAANVVTPKRDFSVEYYPKVSFIGFIIDSIRRVLSIFLAPFNFIARNIVLTIAAIFQPFLGFSLSGPLFGIILQFIDLILPYY